MNFNILSDSTLHNNILKLYSYTVFHTIAVSQSEGGLEAMNERKINFLHYLSTSGVYHDFKEKLKPKLQRAARSLKIK